MKTITYSEDIYKLVPIDSTGAMDDAGLARLPDGCMYIDAERCYNSMLAAVPDTLPGVVVHSGEPVAYMWQHDESGRIGFIDQWQVDNGFWESNPRLHLVSPLFTHPPAQPDTTALQARIAELESHLDTANTALHSVLSQQSQLAAQAGQDPYAYLDDGDMKLLASRGKRHYVSACNEPTPSCTNPLYKSAPPAPANALAIVSAALLAAQRVSCTVCAQDIFEINPQSIIDGMSK